MPAEMPLNELRQARGLSQKMLAEVLQVQQPSIAKIEKRTDMYLSTLRSHIEAMGGELDIVARFPDGTVKISNFSDLGNHDEKPIGRPRCCTRSLAFVMHLHDVLACNLIQVL